MLLLGVSSSLILASQSAYLLSLPATRALGDGKAVGIFRASSRIGQVLGPVAFATIITVSELEAGVAALGACYVVMVLIFLLTSRPPRSRRSQAAGAERPAAATGEEHEAGAEEEAEQSERAAA